MAAAAAAAEETAAGSEELESPTRLLRALAWLGQEFMSDWEAQDLRAVLFQVLLVWLLVSLLGIQVAWRVYGNTVTGLYYRQGRTDSREGCPAPATVHAPPSSRASLRRELPRPGGSAFLDPLWWRTRPREAKLPVLALLSLTQLARGHQVRPLGALQMPSVAAPLLSQQDPPSKLSPGCQWLVC
ncbi:hypothetical protein JRQ81_002797 [Phrynocephalus forsythii]|uniref:T-cell leukemia translocation-altered gene protein homolog n=1 Tax=Phrynocephalus forsythii TaxID=171643 RepID=A0A9Q1AWT8_9SAUR|nr:hypothetical protein JRQ81_002797 [Phrynocephalus forsythii]